MIYTHANQVILRWRESQFVSAVTIVSLIVISTWTTTDVHRLDKSLVNINEKKTGGGGRKKKRMSKCLVSIQYIPFSLTDRRVYVKLVILIFTNWFSSVFNYDKCQWEIRFYFRSTIITFSHFLDAFQRIADLATNTKGGTRDIGTALTRLILRHKSIEQKLKCFANSLVETFIQPLNDSIEDWKKSANTLDKDHAKGLKGKERTKYLLPFFYMINI